MGFFPVFFQKLGPQIRLRPCGCPWGTRAQQGARRSSPNEKVEPQIRVSKERK